MSSNKSSIVSLLWMVWVSEPEVKLSTTTRFSVKVIILCANAILAFLGFYLYFCTVIPS